MAAWGVAGDFFDLPLERNMKTMSKITILLVSATLAGSAFARGPGGGMGGGMGAGMGMSSGTTAQSQNQYRHQYRNANGDAAAQGQGMQTRTQTRDPASNPTGQPIQQRERIHTPGTGLTAPVAPATN